MHPTIRSDSNAWISWAAPATPPPLHMPIATCRACFGPFRGIAAPVAISFLCERGKRALDAYSTRVSDSDMQFWARPNARVHAHRATRMQLTSNSQDLMRATRPHAYDMRTARGIMRHTVRHHDALSSCIPTIQSHSYLGKSFVNEHRQLRKVPYVFEKVSSRSMKMIEECFVFWKSFVKFHENYWRVLCILEKVSSRSMKSIQKYFTFFEKFRQWVYSFRTVSSIKIPHFTM